MEYWRTDRNTWINNFIMKALYGQNSRFGWFRKKVPKLGIFILYSIKGKHANASGVFKEKHANANGMFKRRRGLHAISIGVDPFHRNKKGSLNRNLFSKIIQNENFITLYGVYNMHSKTILCIIPLHVYSLNYFKCITACKSVKLKSSSYGIV